MIPLRRARVVVVRVALDPLRLAVPSRVLPSLKLTDPVGELPPVRVAVSVSDWFWLRLLVELLRVMAGEDLPMETLTLPELTLALLPSPLYCAVML